MTLPPSFNIEDFPIETAEPVIEITMPTGEYLFELVVEDTAGLVSAPDTVTIEVVTNGASLRDS